MKFDDELAYFICPTTMISRRPITLCAEDEPIPREPPVHKYGAPNSSMSRLLVPLYSRARASLKLPYHT